MGRFPNIAAAKAATGAAKGKLYGMYAKEIYQTAKKGGTTPEGNPSLKRLIEKAREDQIPNDIIKRAIDKVNSGVVEDYETVRYELFGPAGSTFIVECLTDNVNRSVSSIRAALNKTSVKMGGQGSVTFNYDHSAVVGVQGSTEDDILEHLVEAGLDVSDIESEGETIVIYADPTALYDVKEALSSLNIVASEIAWVPKELIDISEEDKEVVRKLLKLLDEIDDVQNVYHNVSNI